MPTASKKQRRAVRAAANKVNANFEATIAHELTEALLRIEGEVPDSEAITRHGERQLQETETGGADTVLIWRGKEILRFSHPRITDEGKVLIGIKRPYLEDVAA
jgi:hypothetical protein